MHRAAVWQHSSNSNIKNYPQLYWAFLVESMWFLFWYVLSCLWIVFTNSVSPPHFSNRTLEYLRHNFPWDRFILHQTDNPWPSYSQDLNPPDYLLSGYLKDRICENNPQTREDIIRKEICRIPFYDFINVQYLWRKNLEGFLTFVKVIAKEE